MIIGTFSKQPAEVLDYAIDLTQWLASGDYAVSQVTTAAAGITVDSTLILNSGREIRVWLSGGTSGQRYKIQVLFTTTDGRKKEFEFVVKVQET